MDCLAQTVDSYGSRERHSCSRSRLHVRGYLRVHVHASHDTSFANSRLLVSRSRLHFRIPRVVSRVLLIRAK